MRKLLRITGIICLFSLLTQVIYSDNYVGGRKVIDAYKATIKKYLKVGDDSATTVDKSEDIYCEDDIECGGDFIDSGTAISSTYLKLDASNDPLTEPLTIIKAADDAGLILETYSTSGDDYSRLRLRHSNNDTANTLAETDDFDYLGVISFEGCNTTPAFTWGPRIIARQSGASGTYVPGSLSLEACDATTGSYTAQVFLGTTGYVGIGTTNPSVAFDVVGDGTFTGTLTADTFFDGTLTITDGDLTTTGTVQAEQLSSTDDAYIADKLIIGKDVAPTFSLEVDGNLALVGIKRYSNGATSGPAFLFRRHRGTQASPTSAVAGDYIAKLQVRRGIGTGYANAAYFAWVLDDVGTPPGGYWTMQDANAADVFTFNTKTHEVDLTDGNLSTTGTLGAGATTVTSLNAGSGAITTTGTGTFYKLKGQRGDVSGGNAVALGYNTIASGSISTAMGYYTTASGSYSTAMGIATTASGSISTAMGYYTKAESYAGTAFGKYNVGGGTAGSWVATDPLFELGIGTADAARANALTVYKNGESHWETDSKHYYGLANDVSMQFDGSDWIFNSENVTANDEVHFTNFDAYSFDNDLSAVDGTFTGTVTVSNKVRCATADYRRYYHLPVDAFDPGASGATWVSANANHRGGHQLNAVGETLEFGTDVHEDWDGASDMVIEMHFALNASGSANDTVDLRLQCFYNGDGDTATKTQVLEVPVTTDGTQYKVYPVTFTINWDETDNVVEVNDAFGFILNLETDTSEIDDIILLQGNSSYFYNTTHTGIEDGDT